MSEKFHIRSKGTLGILRSINNVVVFVRVGDENGIDPKQILAGSGIKVSELDDPHRIITTAQEIAVGRNLVERVAVPWLGLELGKYHHLISKGKLGMAAMCCETARDAIKLLISNIDLISTYLQYDISVEGKNGYARLKELIVFHEARPFIMETELVSLYTICSMIINSTKVFRELRLAYPAPDYAERYEKILQCPVKFKAAENMIVFDASFLDAKLPLANPLAKKVLEQECRQLSQRLNEDVRVKDKIRHELLFQKGEFPTLDQLASRINMPERTIRRKLALEETSYKDILSEIRKDRALQMLASGNYSMEKIASDLGYSEVAGFYHAFKTWTGKTPASYRRKGL